MRFRLLLNVNSNGSRKTQIPINYQYELSSWIYQTINQSDGEFSKWLHNTGHTRQNRKFKLFTFSQLVPVKYAVEGDRLTLLSEQVALTVSFYLPKAVEHFITGLFRKQKFQLGDRVSSVDFGVSQVEKLSDVDFNNEMTYRAISPVIISANDAENSRHARYLSPVEEKFSELMAGNLVNKYVALAENGLTEVRNIDEYINGAIRMELKGQPRQKLVKIKAGTTEQVFLKGYLFEFRFTAPVELMRIGYYGGFGEKNSLGFGCCEVVKT